METIENWALHAYADGELEGEEKAAVEELLAQDESARRAVDSIASQKAQLRRAFGGTLEETVPPHLVAAAQGGAGFALRRALAIAAALALLGIGGVMGLEISNHMDLTQQANLAHRAALAHETFVAEVRHPVEVGASEQDHLQAWLSKRVGVGFEIPDLQTQGYTLLGGRLLAEEGGPAGQLMYEDASKKRLTVYVSANKDSKEQAILVDGQAPLITCYWRDAKLAMAVSGDLPKDEMMTLAKNIYEQMDKKG